MALAQGGTTADYMRLLDPDALAKIHRLELIARGLVEGFVSGRHRSPYKGFSVEFAEHRQYVPGDDLRDLDWRVYGKCDRYYIKQYIEETNLRSVILLDASGSMRYTGRQAAQHDGRRLSKFEYGQFLAASLAHLMINQQDAVGLVTFDTKIRRYIPSRSRVTHLRVILDELVSTEPGEESALAPVFHDIAERAHRRGLIVVISDLFDDPREILNALHHFRYRKHEVLLACSAIWNWTRGVCSWTRGPFGPTTSSASGGSSARSKWAAGRWTSTTCPCPPNATSPSPWPITWPAERRERRDWGTSRGQATFRRPAYYGYLDFRGMSACNFKTW